MTELLTVDEAAALLRQTPRTVYAKLRAGVIPVVRLGEGPCAPLRVDAADLEHFIQEHREERTVENGSIKDPV